MRNVSFRRLAILPLAASIAFSAGAADLQVNTEAELNQLRPAIGLAPGGEILVAWDTERALPNGMENVQGQFYGPGGAPVGGQFRISDATLISGRAPAVAADGSGNFVVAWEGGEALIRARRFAADGTPIGTFFNVSADGWPFLGSPCLTVAAEADGDFGVAWIDINYRVAIQRYSANGAENGRRIVTGTAIDPQPQSCPSIAFDDDGNLSVSWILDDSTGLPREIHLRRFAANGAAIGGQIRVDDGVNAPTSPPSVVSDPDGNLLVAWTAENPPFVIDKAVAQRFSAGGVALGGNFDLHRFGNSLRATGDAAGNIVVAIEVDIGLDGMVGRRLDREGRFLGGPIQLSSRWNDNHVYPVVAAEAGGRFVAAWAAVDAGGNDPTLADIFRNEPQWIEGVFADGFESGDLSRWN